jgi:hypothetical protein
MIRINLILTFLCLLSFHSFGQEAKFSLGIEGGVGPTKLFGNEIIDKYHYSRMGASTGIAGQFNFNKHIAVRTGVYFEDKGSELKLQLTDANGDFIETGKIKEHFMFFNLPFMARATFGNQLKYFVNAGAYYAFLYKVTEVYEGTNDYPEMKIDQLNNFKRHEIGFTAGVGIAYHFSFPLAISLEARNNLGLNNLSNQAVINNGTIKTNGLNFLLGLSYQFGK